MRTDADVVIVGGGVHGVSCAYHLARAGKDVVLLEKEAVGSGASGYSGGIIRSHYSNPAMVRLAHRAAQLWPALEADLGHPVDYVRNGLIIAVAAEDVDAMRGIVAMQQGIGVQTALISPAEISQHIPEYRTDGLALACYEAEAGYADPYSTAQAFAQKARKAGAELCIGVAATGLELAGATVRAVQTSQGSIRAGLVINCAGAWAARIAAMAGIDLPVRPGVIEMAAFNPAYAGWTRNSPTWVDLTTMTYCRPDGAGYLLAGGGLAENTSLESEEPDPDPDHYPANAPLLFEAEMQENLQARLPWAKGMRKVRTWTGRDGNSPDYHLIFGAVPGVHGYLQVVAGSGNSFKLSPATGEAVAEYVATGRCTYLDTEAFSVTRFTANRPFVGSYRMHIVG